jgi:O-succinylbenzoic acid--CoA ligase
MERAELNALVQATGCAETVGGQVFLCDPAWSAAQRARWRELQAMTDRRPEGETGGWLGIATGGTSGGLRFARHDERTLGSAAEGLRAHFGLRQINALDVLPPHHVSGLMARIRAFVTRGRHVAWSWKQLESGQRPTLEACADGWVISLVPTQLQRLLTMPAAVDWLRGFRAVFVGGGPAWPELTETAARAGLPLALSYGLSETAAMVTALRPEEFLAGERSSGRALPHARVTTDADGVVRVAGESVCRGYWPEWQSDREWTTEDLGAIDERGFLRLLGRRDAVIITGGKKVQPAEVEAVLRAAAGLTEVAVIGVPDAEWGEKVVACYPAAGGTRIEPERWLETLAPQQRPKQFLAIERWPANAQGKVNRAELRAAAIERLRGRA